MPDHGGGLVREHAIEVGILCAFPVGGRGVGVEPSGAAPAGGLRNHRARDLDNLLLQPGDVPRRGHRAVVEEKKVDAVGEQHLEIGMSFGHKHAEDASRSVAVEAPRCPAGGAVAARPGVAVGVVEEPLQAAADVHWARSDAAVLVPPEFPNMNMSM